MDRTEQPEKWLIELTQHRYAYLELSFDQAEKLYYFEETKFEFTTRWDEIERERAFMESMLNEIQYNQYLIEHNRNIQLEEKYIREKVGESEKQIRFLMAQKSLILQTYHPILLNLKREFEARLNESEKSELDELSESYLLLIQEDRKTGKSTIDLHTRGLNPKAYEEFDLSMDIREILPEPWVFELKDKERLSEIHEFIQTYRQKLAPFTKGMPELEKAYGNALHELRVEYLDWENRSRGWEYVITSSEEEMEFERAFEIVMSREFAQKDTHDGQDLQKK